MLEELKSFLLLDGTSGIFCNLSWLLSQKHYSC